MAQKIVKKTTRKPKANKLPDFQTVPLPAASASTVRNTAPLKSVPVSGKATLEIYPSSGWEVGGTQPVAQFRSRRYLISPLTSIFTKAAQVASNYTKYRLKDFSIVYKSAVGSTATGMFTITTLTGNCDQNSLADIDSQTAATMYKDNTQVDIKNFSTVFYPKFDPTIWHPLGVRQSNADDKLINVLAICITMQGCNTGLNDRVGTFYFDYEFELDGVGPSLPLDTANFDMVFDSAGYMPAVNFADSDIGLWWKKSLDNTSYYWTGQKRTFDFTVFQMVPANSSFVAGFVIKRGDTVLSFDTVTTYVVGASSGSSTDNIRYGTGQIILEPYDRITFDLSMPSASRVILDIRPTMTRAVTGLLPL